MDFPQLVNTMILKRVTRKGRILFNLKIVTLFREQSSKVEVLGSILDNLEV